MAAAFEIPKDEQGQPKPHDHPNFDGPKRVIRRVQSEHIVPARNGQGYRISTAIFKNARPAPNNYISCDSEHCIIERSLEPSEYVTGAKWRGALAISGDAIRATHQDLLIGMWPLSHNICHGAIWGKVTSGQAKGLLAKCEWLLEIEDVAITE